MRSFYYSFYRINSQFNDFLTQKIQKEEKSAMRNLKKILALALALVMSLSLMATANAFTDDDSITDTYETAVTVLSGLKVFQGYDDGTFQPQGAITRAEVAAIIYRIVTGDVADTQVGIYADYNKFDDVASTSWYAGYVNFCANAEYIKGYDARTFGPNDPVTGYQALAMILRALGYDKNGEFTGTNWQVQTAAVGESRGITKNITAGTLGVPATREVVAEILFRAILVNTVNYTPAFGYRENKTSLGWETFELEDITGVVVANEYADLYSDSPMDEGETELDVDGESYVIDYTSTFDDIGESRHAYITGATVLALSDAGNVTFETGDEADIDTASKFESVTGLERTTTTEQFVNFDGGSTYEASDWRIEYVINDISWTVTASTSENAEAQFKAYFGIDDDDSSVPGTISVAAGTTRNQWIVTYDAGANAAYEQVIRPGATITTQDMNCMREIFYSADRNSAGANNYVLGEVYVGTQSTDDISDDADVSWNIFVDRYIETSENSVAIDDNVNGNWLKAIDNDGDGEAEYVLQVIYTVAGVQDISNSGTITLSNEDDALTDGDAVNEITDDNAIVTEDELAEGDIVYYAVIDGNAYTYLADVVTAEIDRVNRNDLSATTTDGDEYIESGVHEHTGWDEIISGVRNLEGDVNYDLYLDRFGYLAAFTESDNNAGFVLLTDGYYETGRTEDTFAAMVWDREAQELVDTDITDGGELFIDTNGDDNDWGNLSEFVPINYSGADDDIQTIVAALGEDGSLTPVDEVYRYRVNVAMIDMDTTIPVRAHTENGTIYSTTRHGAYEQAGASVDVRALASTVYYYVYNTPLGNTVVREYVGYANIPDLGKDVNMIEDVYVVGTRAEDAYSTDYYTAEIVVVELKDGYTEIDSEQVFLYDLPVAGSGVKYEEASVIRADGTVGTVTIDLSKSDFRSYDPADGKWEDWDVESTIPGLYYMWESDVADVYVVRPMTWTEIANSNYVVGTVLRDTATGADDWTSFIAYVNNNNENFFMFEPNGETEKRNTEDSNYYTLGYDFDEWSGPYGELRYDYSADFAEGDREDVLAQRVDGDLNTVLVKYDGSNNIVYAISFNRWDDRASATPDFAQFVWAWNTPAADIPDQTTVTFYGQPVAMNADGEFVDDVDYSVAKANEALDGDAIKVENGSIVIKDYTVTDVSTRQKVYTGTILGEDGEYYTFSLTQNAAGTDNKLYLADGKTEVNQDVTGGKKSDLDMPASPLTIPEYVEQFRAQDNATVMWTFETNGGEIFDVKTDMYGDIIGGDPIPENVTTDEIADVKAVVTSEADKPGDTYEDTADIAAGNLSALQAAKAAAEEAVQAALLDAIDAEAADEDVTLPTDVLADPTTFNYGSWGLYTVQSLLTHWNSVSIGVQTTVADVESVRDSLIGETADAAEDYVAVLKSSQAADDGVALNALYYRLIAEKIETAEVTSAIPSVIEGAIEDAIKAAINDDDAYFTVTSWDDLSAQLSGGISGAGTIVLEDVVISLGYGDYAGTLSTNLGEVIIPYNVSR